MTATRDLVALFFLVSTSTSSLAGTPPQPSSSSALAAEQDADGLRKWQPRDSIPVRIFGDSLQQLDRNAEGHIAVPSPDGRYFYVLSNRGDLACDCNIRTLEVFDSLKVSVWVKGGSPRSTRPKPIKVVQRLGAQKRSESGQSRDPIQVVGWRQKENDLVFLGSDGVHDQVYRLKFPSGELEALTSDPFNKIFSSIALEGSTVLYLREVRTSIALAPVYPAVILPRSKDGQLSYPVEPTTFKREYVVQRRGQTPWVLPLHDVGGITPYFAPAGDKVAIVDVNTRPQIRRARLLLLDVIMRNMREIASINTDVMDHARVPTLVRQAVWSDDGSNLIMIGMGLPITSSNQNKGDSSNIIVYNALNRQWSRVETLSPLLGSQLRGVRWVQPGRQLLVTRTIADGPLAGELYTLEGDHWVGRDASPGVDDTIMVYPSVALAGGLSVELRQAANEPPALVASASGREGLLLDPDPALNGLARAKVEPFSWQMPDGGIIKSTITLPREPAPPGGYPLVIQIGRDGPGAFLPDGPMSNPFARQALAARGMAVLALSASDINDGDMAKEGQTFVDRVDHAVDKLVADGVANRLKVGLVGFSKTGFFAHYAATHPGKTPIRAAEAVDSTTHSLVEYLVWIAIRGNLPGQDVRDAAEGGNPWQNRPRWSAQDPIMNADKGDAAILYTTHGNNFQPGRYISELGSIDLSVIAAMERNRRAFEYFFLPGAHHAALLPRERLLLMTANVDWMSFWLQGYEDPAPEKAEQYSRWRFLRTRNEQRIADRNKTTSQVNEAN